MNNDLGNLFRRVVTQKKTDFKDITPFEKNLVMNMRWTNEIDKNLNLDQEVTRKRPLPIQKFHENFASRIEHLIHNNKFNFEKFYGIKKPIEYDEIEAENKNADREYSNFIDGHFLSLEGFTKVSKVFVTMFSKTPDKKGHRFFLPLEQALLCQNIGEYRGTVAILKDWDSYSNFGLMVLPAGAYVSFRVGITAPQFFPNLTKFSTLDNSVKTFLLNENSHSNDLWSFYKERSTVGLENVRESLKNINNPTDELWRFYESLPGGSTQFLFAYAYHDVQKRTPVEIDDWDSVKSINVFEIKDCLYESDSKGKKQALNLKFSHKINRKWSADNIKDTHFFREGYDKIDISFPLAFEKAGILKEKERKSFEHVIKGFKARALYE